ncbi:hypothetical protein MNB_SUP05-SYMBIONT-5-307 [hydrothermal vent metagenome]|uniref:Uncharacterized protein n=1 Tax=hydrothermal vent metagenome TaxID=652676 RepID=A0A1W1E652_9ZZZZ
MLDAQKILTSMQRSVNKALALKKALGHYAVVWDDKTQQVKRIEAKDLPEYQYKDEQ